MAGLKNINVIISKKDDKNLSLASIIENVQREDLNSLEEADAYNSLIKEHKLTHEDISKFTGKSRSYITNIIRLIGLPDNVKKQLVLKKDKFWTCKSINFS